MPVLYKLLQDKKPNSSTRGQWYARSITTDTVDLDELAEIIQRNCTAKKSDVYAVLIELSSAMNELLRNSKRVKIDGFGSFKIGLNTKYAPTPEEFSVEKNVVGSHVIFLPERQASGGKKFHRTFLDNLDVRKTVINDTDK